MALFKMAVFILLIGYAGFFGATRAGERAGKGNSMGSKTDVTRIRLSFDGKEAVVRLHDHPTTRDLLSRLPLTLDFQDYVGKEKIAYLSNKLNSDGSSAVGNGDFAYYAPWGNLAIFHRGSGNAGGGLIVLGSIESGKEYLAAVTENFTAKIELFD